MWIHYLMIFQARHKYIIQILSSCSCWKQKSCHFLSADLYVRKTKTTTTTKKWHGDAWFVLTKPKPFEHFWYERRNEWTIIFICKTIYFNIYMLLFLLLYQFLFFILILDLLCSLGEKSFELFFVFNVLFFWLLLRFFSFFLV